MSCYDVCASLIRICDSQGVILPFLFHLSQPGLCPSDLLTHSCTQLLTSHFMKPEEILTPRVIGLIFTLRILKNDWSVLSNLIANWKRGSSVGKIEACRLIYNFEEDLFKEENNF